MPVSIPIRLQLSRKKGFNLQALSIATNGLPAVNVARPGKWGNPYKAGSIFSAAECVVAHREMLLLSFNSLLPTRRAATRAAVADLRGRNLACWCAPDAPCHADNLLQLANLACEETTP